MPTTTANAAAREEPMTRIRAGARRSKNRSKLARDMTHTFEFEPRGGGRVSYLNSAKIAHI